MKSLTFPKVFIFTLCLVTFGCEGPMGPAGPMGPQGEKGDQGPAGATREAIIIERALTPDLYDPEGAIVIQDARITPTTFRVLYLKTIIQGDDVLTIYMPVDYILASVGAPVLSPEAFQLPVLSVSNGSLLILDPQRILLQSVEETLRTNDNYSITLAILVSG